MALPRLRTQLLVTALLILFVFTGAVLLILRQMVQSEIGSQARDVTDLSVSAFLSLQSQNETQLLRMAAILSEQPAVKALMTSGDPATIQNASETWWNLAGSDLLVLANPQGRLLALHAKQPGWTQARAEELLLASFRSGEGAPWWNPQGQLYWVALQPIESGEAKSASLLGYLAVGYQVNSALASRLALVSGSQIALAVNQQVVASTLGPEASAAFQAQLGRAPLPPNTTRDIRLGSAPFRVASVLIHPGSPAPVNCYVLMSMQQWASFLAGLNRMVLVLFVSAVCLAALLLTVISRRITHPLENLVAGVRALAAGNYSYAIAPRGSAEVAALSAAFSKMRADLLESQTRWMAAERIAALGRAASSISHDLRHYLAALVANAEFLYEAEKLKLNRDEVYEEIQAASKQMTELLDSLRELAREERHVAAEPAALDQLLRRAADAVLMRPEFRNRAISIGTRGDLRGTFDARKLERAFVNILVNACEATAPGSGRIQVEATGAAESFTVRISDNGSGIPEAIRESLFDPFVSAGKQNGTGLGLAIVSKMIQDHEGSVAVEQSSASGTTILVRLPRSLQPAASGGARRLADQALPPA